MPPAGDDSGRLLFVVQRYGVEVGGGAETHCRQFATRLVERGYAVDVLTSRAVSAADWADAYPPGRTEIDGVGVHRLGVAHPKDEAAFDAFTVDAIWGKPPPPLAVQERWLEDQGPALPGLVPWLCQRAGDYDRAIFFTYLYSTCWAGLPAVAGRLPTVLHATAHDEPYFWLPVFDTMLRLPSVYAWTSEEERDLLARRGTGDRPGLVVGDGVKQGLAGDGRRLRAAHPELGERPYLVYVGRVTAGKGALELLEYFARYKRRGPGPSGPLSGVTGPLSGVLGPSGPRRGVAGSLALVLVGEAGPDVTGNPDVVVTGFVDDDMLADAVAGSVALVNPSFYESFSAVLCEAWVLGRPTIVQGRTDVLAGLARRSGGGIPYTGYPEWEAAVDVLVEHPELGERLGEAGRRYVESRFGWDTVLDRYERLLHLAGHAFRER